GVDPLLLEVGADAGPQRFRLSDVEHVAAAVAEQVNARPRGQRLQLRFELSPHSGKASHGQKGEAARWRSRAAPRGRQTRGSERRASRATLRWWPGNAGLTSVNIAGRHRSRAPPFGWSRKTPGHTATLVLPGFYALLHSSFRGSTLSSRSHVFAPFIDRRLPCGLRPPGFGSRVADAAD